MDQKLDDILNMLQAQLGDQPQAQMSGQATPPVRQLQQTTSASHPANRNIWEPEDNHMSPSHPSMSGYFQALVSQDSAVSWVKWNILL